MAKGFPSPLYSANVIRIYTVSTLSSNEFKVIKWNDKVPLEYFQHWTPGIN